MTSIRQPIYYQGSVKNLIGPVQVRGTEGVIFEYTDGFSVFDWGRMPDVLSRKGEALAILAADFFERLEKPESWREFSKSSEALAMRKANRFGSIFNELGEVLQSEGLRTHYLGVLEEGSEPFELEPKRIMQVNRPFRKVVARRMTVVQPDLQPVLGRRIPDYRSHRSAGLPKLIPLEVVFRMSCPEGSSLLGRVAKDSGYLASLGYPDLKVAPGVCWDFPVLELFTKLESTDRIVSLTEALSISGIAAQKLQEVLLKTVWVSHLLKYWCARAGLELADGKLEWGLAQDGSCLLVDAIGPDELRILKDGVPLSKEFLRSFYRKTSWYAATEQAKANARKSGVSEWKRGVIDIPPSLPSSHKQLAAQVYLSLTNAFTGKSWFGEAYGLDKIIHEVRLLQKD